MKKINKLHSPLSFETWKNTFRISMGREPLYNDLQGQIKQELKEIIMKEQGFLCCYCMARVEYYNSHIEHFKPKGDPQYQSLQLEYDNLLVSCEGSNFTQDNCGHKKYDWFDPLLIISPMESGVESLFEYTWNGHILASNSNQRATETIAHLNLDNFLLCRHRYAAINGAITNEELSDMTNEQIDDLIAFFSLKNQNEELYEFCGAIINILESFKAS